MMGWLEKTIRRSTEERRAMKTVKIRGMSCMHCVKAVAKVLSEIDGVTDVRVDLSAGEATFEEATPVDIEVIREKIKKAGYEPG